MSTAVAPQGELLAQIARLFSLCLNLLPPSSSSSSIHSIFSIMERVYLEPNRGEQLANRTVKSGLLFLKLLDLATNEHAHSQFCLRLIKFARIYTKRV